MAEVTQLRAKKKEAVRFPPGFVAGAIVKLKSGGATMSVTERLSGSPPAVHCEWQSSDFYPQERSYPIAALRLAEADEVDYDGTDVEFALDEGAAS